MLKPDERQGSFYDPEYICEQLIPQDSFYRKFRQKQKIRVRSTHFTFHKLMLISLISEGKGIINISYEQEDRRLFCEMCRPDPWKEWPPSNRMTSLDNTTSSGTAIAVYAYTLDNDGNRTGISQTVPLTMNAAATNIPFSYNSQGGRLLSAGSNNFTYDNEGQLSSGYSNNYTFDYNHRLTGIGTNYQFSYDGTGNRLKAVRYGITTKYIYDLQGNLLADTDVNNNILHYYVYGAGLLEMVDSTGAYCYHFDATGNTVAMTNSSQNIANAYTNDPFGNILDQQETDPQPFKYVGQYGVMAEANGFCYMRARYYDPQVGRFVSEDPSGFG